MGHENGSGRTSKRVAVYCRVSTSDQDVARQERDLAEYAARARARADRTSGRFSPRIKEALERSYDA